MSDDRELAELRRRVKRLERELEDRDRPLYPGQRMSVREQARRRSRIDGDLGPL